MLTIRTFRIGELQTNCYFICSLTSHEALVVDPADASEYICDVLTRESLIPIGILATHGHFDHILGAFGLQMTYNIPFYIHADDEFLVRRAQESGQYFLKRKDIDPAPIMNGQFGSNGLLTIGNDTVHVIHVPGHTPGSVAYVVPSASAVLVGDTMFADGSIGRTDSSYGDHDMLINSIKRIVRVEGITTLYPGHGESLPFHRAKIIFGV